MSRSETLNATEFKATCLNILDRIGKRELERVVITKHGRPVAMLTAPEAEAAQVRQLHGFMRGSVVIPSGVDLTAPVADETFSAGLGELHG